MTNHDKPKPMGRPPSMTHKSKRLVIDASEAEYRAIVKALSTRERTRALLRAIEAKQCITS